MLKVAFMAAAGVALAFCAAPLNGAKGGQAEGVAPASREQSVTEWSSRRKVRRPTRIYVYPSSRLYRECVDWFVLDRRPSGDVIMPQMRCRWVAR